MKKFFGLAAMAAAALFVSGAMLAPATAASADTVTPVAKSNQLQHATDISAQRRRYVRRYRYVRPYRPYYQPYGYYRPRPYYYRPYPYYRPYGLGFGFGFGPRHW